ncbi:MAG: hypothetical protein Q4C56_07960 [Peptococcaceae bacterium]|nr:hypothetical protein [Peptococcaceae bacterium]
MNLQDLIDATSPLRVHPERCIHCYSPRARCNQCVLACPSKCISISDGEVKVEGCDGCGRCLAVCPHDVFEMDFPKVYAQGQSPLVIACERMQLSDLPVLSAHCLSQFTWLELALLVQKFGEVYLCCTEARCEDCAHSWLPIGQTAMLARYGLPSLAEHLHIIRDEDALEALVATQFGEANTRRAYMQNQWARIKDVGKNYSRQSVEAYLDAFEETLHQHSGRTLQFEKTASHCLLLSEIYEALPQLEEETIPLQALENSRCRFCGVCERMCPWQALAILEEDHQAMLVHHDVLCARCGLCIDLCPEHGLHWSHGLTPKAIAEPHWRKLAAAEARECEACGEWFYPTEDSQTRCAICRNKIS